MGVAVCLAVVLAGCADSGDSGEAGKAQAGKGEHAGSTSYQISDRVMSLDLEGGGGDVTLTAGTGPITVTERMEYLGRIPVTSHSVVNGTLRLTTDRCSAVGVCKVSYTITAPAAVAANLVSKGGAISVSGMSGAVAVKADGGRVILDRISAPTVTVNTGGGPADVTMSAMPRSVSVRTRGGELTMALPGGPYAVTAKSAGGRKEIGVTTAATGAKVDVSTAGGKTTIKQA
ncbi:lipoprotein [Amorphoplanes auranticolor]|uniref:Lipoprotein n=2 Tax=Actinoplanes auranticolor TaxID=47988 RepID=A0A919SXB6_9ACTN|nr:lipoprotein [Actinoplanes auranticolor]